MNTKDPRSEYVANLHLAETVVAKPMPSWEDPAPVRNRVVAKPGFLSYIKALFSNWKGK